MPLNKFAAWGREPVAAARSPGLGAVTRNGLKALNSTLQQRLPTPAPAPAPTPGPATPSATGLRVVWSLGAVRDALTDQNRPTLAACNRQIDVQRESAAVKEVRTLLEQEYPELHDPYLLQFRPLQSAVPGFELERRERLAELAAVELEIMAAVEDLRPAPSPTTAGARRARKHP